MTRFSFLFAALGLGTSLAHAAGFQFIEIPGNGSHQPLKGAVWYPCNQPPGKEKLGPFVLSVAKNCPVTGAKLSLSLYRMVGAALSSIIVIRQRR